MSGMDVWKSGTRPMCLGPSTRDLDQGSAAFTVKGQIEKIESFQPNGRISYITDV